MENNTVFINGCFDILHPGHVRLFKFAKSFGTELIVGIDSDRRIKINKGDNRPINDEKFRQEMLLSIKYIDRVFIYDSDMELQSLIKQISPSVMVIGSDWKNKNIIGSEFAKKLIFFDRIEPYASTNIIDKIKI